MKFLYMAGVNIILLVNQIMNILSDKYFKTVFEWKFASITSWALRFLNIDILQGSVATYLRCGGILKKLCKFTTESVSERILKIG